MSRTGNESLRRLVAKHAFDTPKLVRDRIPEMIKEDGDKPVTRKVKGEEYSKFLLDKIQEEAKELSSSGDKEELADLMEVLDAYRFTENISIGEIKELRSEKADEKGGFSKGVILEDIE